MRKVMVTVMALFLVITSTNVLQASEYLSYQDSEFKHDGMRYLDDYTQSMYDKSYDKVDKRKFWGWRTYTKYKTEPVTYTKETLYVIYNEGTTAITETFYFETTNSIKKQFNVSGSVGLDASVPIKGFKLGLEKKLDHSITATVTDTFEEEINIKVMVDPDTQLSVQIKGEGLVSNGVAMYYVCWKRVRKGGWEVFTVTTEYYSIVKERIV